MNIARLRVSLRNLATDVRARVTALRHHRAAMDVWLRAETLAELGECTAGWLEGRVCSQPGYTAGAGPDPETRDLIPTLAAACRAGFVTRGSQPGIPRSTAWDGNTPYVQCAAVEGYADHATATALRAATAGAGLIVIVHEDFGIRRSYDDAVDVTYNPDTGEGFTCFGYRPASRDIRFGLAGCSTAAVAAVLNGVQITLIDPVPGRNDLLWPTLDTFAARRPEQDRPCDSS